MNEMVEPTVVGRPAARPVDHPPVRPGRIGVLLMNLGTPEATDYRSMRRYLKEFLSDRRVIETPRLLWWPLLNLVILSTRPGRKGRDYETIWNKERNEGPLKTITRAQAEEIGRDLARVHGDRVRVDWAMRYGKPEVSERLKALLAEGCDRILLVPLYPQYSAATSATACDQAFRALMEMRWQPAVRVSPPYFDDEVYIDALASSMRREFARLAFQPDVILVSFHGVPKEYLLKGDPYHCHCVKTWRLLREAFGWPEERFRISLAICSTKAARPPTHCSYAGPIGAYAEERLIAADRVVKIPDNVDDQTAAAIMLKGMTAQYLLRRIIKVGLDTTLLFHAAAGGVGLIACQWAAALGATVIGTVGSSGKALIARAHGCGYVINTREEDFVAKVKDYTKGKGVDVVYDSIGKDTFPGSLDCLKPLGLWVSFGQFGGGRRSTSHSCRRRARCSPRTSSICIVPCARTWWRLPTICSRSSRAASGSP